jgi:hypothetical protein
MTAFRCVIIIAAFFAIIQCPLSAEHIFLDDGSILNGKIIRESSSEITVKLDDGKTKTVPSARIMRTIFYDLYIGKIFVNKTDGTVLEAYMVDEDQKYYTFRKELYKPEEFRVKRGEVLFIARKNPTNLTGEFRDESITAKWNPPFNKVKSYNVYLRAGSGTYSLYRETAATSCVIGKLQGNTSYKVKVTAVDAEEYESLPSNEITVGTPNNPPEPPSRVRLEKKTVSDSRTAGKTDSITAKLSWEAASDVDGKVLSYNVYLVKRGEYRLVTSTNLTAFEVTGLDPQENSSFIVRAVDNTNAESRNSRSADISGSASGFAVSAAPCFIAPQGNFSSISGNGFGVRVTAMNLSVLAGRIGTGLSLEFLRFGGGRSEVRSTTIIPLTAVMECRFRPGERFSIVPELGAGYSYNRTDYTGKALYPDGFREGTLMKTSFEPIASAGLRLEILFAGHFSAGLGVRYGALIESSKPQRFASAECSFGLMF